MSFVFISHAQADKLRPDGRMRQLVHYIFQAGIPIWIDRPEELELAAEELKHRCIGLTGKWTSDIVDALNRCSAGIGMWSRHAEQRLREDRAGVLFQEMNTLSITRRLHLVSIDPGAMGAANEAFNHLSKGQQVVDLGSVKEDVLVGRVTRLLRELGATTKSDAKRLRVHLQALSTRGAKGAFELFTGPEVRRARQAMDALLAAFAAYDPGPLPLLPTAELAAALNRVAKECEHRNTRFRTFHALLALMQLPSHFVQNCFDGIEPGLGARIEAWLKEQAQKHNESFVAGDAVGAILAQASAVAQKECASAIDERHCLLALLKGVSGTTSAIRDLLGAGRYGSLVEIAEAGRPVVQPMTQTMIERPNPP